MKRLQYWFFHNFLPFYFPRPCTILFLAIWSAPTEPATLTDHWKALRVTIRTHSERWGARPLLIIKRGGYMKPLIEKGDFENEFIDWLKLVVKEDDGCAYLLDLKDEDYNDDRAYWYLYFTAGLTPFQAIQRDREEYA